MTPEETRDAMEQYASKGRVTSGPAAPGGPARKPSDKKKDFDEMLRKMEVADKQGAYPNADEPTFALGFGKKTAGLLKEFEHQCIRIQHPARELVAACFPQPLQAANLFLFIRGSMLPQNTLSIHGHPSMPPSPWLGDPP